MSRILVLFAVMIIFLDGKGEKANSGKLTLQIALSMNTRKPYFLRTENKT